MPDIPHHPGQPWWQLEARRKHLCCFGMRARHSRSIDLLSISLTCMPVGRTLWILAMLHAMSPLRRLRPAVFHEWAKLISNGVPGLDLLLPPEHIRGMVKINYAGLNPAWRPRRRMQTESEEIDPDYNGPTPEASPPPSPRGHAADRQSGASVQSVAIPAAAAGAPRIAEQRVGAIADDLATIQAAAPAARGVPPQVSAPPPPAAAAVAGDIADDAEWLTFSKRVCVNSCMHSM